MTDTWSPAQYDKFRQEREQPFFDLLSLVKARQSARVVDLGCGTGRLTRILHARVSAAETVGIDRSARMLDAQNDRPLPSGLTFELATIESFPADRGKFDLIFSNAALHWVEDHEALLTRLAAALPGGGQLAFQVPAEHDSLSHRLAADLADMEPFRSAFSGWQRAQPVLSPEAYARLLHRIGMDNQSVRLMVYPHILPGPDDVIEWMRGTLLTEYLRHLPPELGERFVDDYRRRLLTRLAGTRPFFFPFKRILCWGQSD